MNVRTLGTIAFIQVSPSPVKVPSEPERYDPTPLTRVEQLLLNRRGSVGIASDGRWLMDVHHADHPQSRNRRIKNSISINFTCHYAAMRSCFGSHLVDGCAAENIVITSDVQRTMEDLGTFLIIHHPQVPQCVIMEFVRVAEPCLPFVRYALDVIEEHSPADLKAGLQFLRAGIRGFYLLPVDDTVQSILPGATVYATDAPTYADAGSLALQLTH